MATAALTAFSLRRLVLLAASLRPRQTMRAFDTSLPSVTLLVPAHDEAATIDATLLALGRLDYPAERLFTVLIDDASHDRTGEHFARWATGRARTMALVLPLRLGKEVALNAGLAAAPESDLVAICDADLRPRPQSLRLLTEAFADAEVAAAAPFLSPENASESAVASYAGVESWVHQLVTSEGKDNLDLNPVTNGGSVYRRSAIESLGGFPRVPSGEDVSTTVALTRAGWRTRFVRDAVIDNTVVNGWKEYWHQHLRWSRNLLSTVAADGPRAIRRPSLARRIELRIQSAGYGDRLALLAAIILVLIGRLPLWIPVSYAVLVAAQIGIAVFKAGAGSKMPRYLFWTVAFYGVDAAASTVSVILHVLRRPRRWTRAPRAETTVISRRARHAGSEVRPTEV